MMNLDIKYPAHDLIYMISRAIDDPKVAEITFYRAFQSHINKEYLKDIHWNNNNLILTVKAYDTAHFTDIYLALTKALREEPFNIDLSGFEYLEGEWETDNGIINHHFKFTLLQR